MLTKAAADPICSRDYLMIQAGRYLDGRHPESPDVNALHGDLSGFPPLFIQAGEADVLLDDSLRLAARASKMGVEVRLEVAPEMVHVYPFFFPVLSEGRTAVATAAAYIRQKTHE